MSSSGDRNLLLGVLALQMDLITRDQLVEGVKAWLPHRERSLEDVLVERGALSPAARGLLAPIVEFHLAKHGGDAARSLAALSTIAPVQQALSAIGDVNLQTALSQSNIPETLTDPDATSPIEGRLTRDTMRQGVGRGADGDSATESGSRYLIERPHAHGGLGEVFVALDVELNRKVALKQIREQHADDPVSRSQFLVEGEITGGLEHPGIIPVYGLGRYASGRPYYAMRFVEGDTLQAAIERFHNAGGMMTTSERNLAFRELLRRFLDVCHAVAYAHQRGVLHRDLKPGNVLLGGFGETLVIDWGLAKVLGKATAGLSHANTNSQTEATTERLPEPVIPSHEPLATVGRGAHGTPGYMSPEQVSGDIDALGPATDIYSLGAILYHLLTNRPPLTREDGDVLGRTIRGDFPPARQVKPDTPSGLDAVCRKATALRPGDRYVAVEQLREDVDHWLADEPVSAWREPLPVKARRWVRKHPGRVAALTATVLMAMIAVGVGWLVVGEKNRALTQALSGEKLARERADDRTRVANDRFKIALETFNRQVFDADKLLRNRPGTQDLRKAVMSQALDGLQKLVKEAEETEGADRIRAWAHIFLGDIYLSIDGQVEKAHKEYQKAFELCKGLADPKNALSQRDLSISHDKMGRVLYRTGDMQKALEHYQESMSIAKSLADADPKDAQRQRDLSIAFDQIGDVLLRLGQVQKAMEQYQESWTIRKRLANPNDAGSQRDLSRSFDQIGDVLYRQGQLGKAMEQYQEAMTIRKRLADPKDAQSQRDLSYSHDQFGKVLLRKRDLQKALEHYQESMTITRRLADADPRDAFAQRSLAIAYDQIGNVLIKQEQVQKALEQYQESMKITKRLAEADPRDAVTQRSLSIAYDKLGDVLLKQEEYEKALEPYQESLHIARRLADADPKDTQSQRDLAIAYDQIGKVRYQLKQYQQALEQYQEELKICNRLARTDFRDVQSQRDLAIAYDQVGDVLLKQGETAKALEHFQEAMTIRKRLANPRDADSQRGLSIAHDMLGRLLLKQGELKKAMVEYEASMNIARRLADAAPRDALLQRDLAIAYDQIGDVLLKQKQVKKAMEQYEEGLRIRKGVAARDPANLAAQWDVYLRLDALAWTWSDEGDPARAAEWHQKSLDVLHLLDKAGKVKDPKVVKALGQTEEYLRDCREAEQALGNLDMLLKLPEAVKLLVVRADWLMRQGKTAEAATAADRLSGIAKDGASFFASASAYAWCARDKANENGHAGRCVEMLRKARDGGYFKDADKVKALKADEAFMPLLGREEFKKLLAELEKKPD